MGKELDKILGDEYLTNSTRRELEEYIKQYGIQERILGMEQAKSRVLRRTEIPKGARNPTRDHIVILGEEIAQFISDDISALKDKETTE